MRRHTKSQQANVNRALGACGLLLALALPANAQEIPDLVGTWSGAGTAVFIGSTPYRAPDASGANLPAEEIEFTYEIREQEGNRFAGMMSGGLFTEAIVGALQPPDYATGVMIDNDGRYTFTLRAADTIDLCYDHQYPTTKWSLAGR
jgi:hypothetical protein